MCLSFFIPSAFFFHFILPAPPPPFQACLLCPFSLPLHCIIIFPSPVIAMLLVFWCRNSFIVAFRLMNGPTTNQHSSPPSLLQPLVLLSPPCFSPLPPLSHYLQWVYRPLAPSLSFTAYWPRHYRHFPSPQYRRVRPWPLLRSRRRLFRLPRPAQNSWTSLTSCTPVPSRPA